MSGAVGLQGRYATGFGYGPRLGVGRYPSQAANNALLAVQGFNNPRPVTYPQSYVAPAEMVTPAPAQAGTLAPVSGGGGMNDLLMAAVPAALGIGGTYLLRKFLADDSAAAGTGVSDAYAQFGQDIAANFGADAVGNLAADATLPLAGMIGAEPAGMLSLPGSFADLPSGSFPGVGDWASGADDIFSMNAATDVAGDAVGAAGSAATSWNPLDWSITTPGTGAFGLDLSVGPLTFNPVNIAAGAAGSYGGSRLAQHLAPFSGAGQKVGSGIGGLAGGALGGAVFGPVGALVGAFLGSLGGGTIGADSPNYPYSYFGANVGNGTLDFWDPASRNGGDASAVRPLTNALRDYITGRMAAEGMVVNPYKGGERAFSAGTTADPNGKFFVGASDINPATAAYGMGGIGAALFRAVGPSYGFDPSQTMGVWRGDNVSDLPGQVWNQLTGSGIIGAPGSFGAPAPAAPAPPPEPMADPWANYGSGG